MPFTIFTSFDGVTHGVSTDYYGLIEHGTSVAMTSSIAYTSRFGQRPIRNSLTVEARQVPFTLVRGPQGTATNPETWWENVRRIYGVNRGERLLVATHNSVDVYLEADVLSLDLLGPFHAEGVLSAADGIYTAVSAGSAVTSSPITPSGNADAYPILTITPTGANVNYRAITVTPNNDEGLTDYPVRIGGGSTEGGALALNTVSAPAAADYMVFVDGQPVPFLVQGYNTATGKLDVTISGKPGEAIQSYLFYGTNIANALAQQFQAGGLALDSAGYSNSSIRYRYTPGTVEGVLHPSVWDAQAAIERPLSFVPSQAVGGPEWDEVGIYGAGVVTGGFYPTDYGLHISASVFGIAARSYAMVSPIPADTLEYVLAYDSTPAAVSDWLYYRTRANAWFGSQPPSGFETQTSHDIDDANLVLLALYGKHVIMGSQDPVLTLKTATLPTISIGSAATGHRLNMDIETPRSTIQIRDLYTANVALVINTLTQSIAPASGNVLYFGPGGGITFTNRDEWLPLTAGVANAYTVTNLGGSDVTVSWSVPARYAL